MLGITARGIVKGIATSVVGAGVAKIVGQAVANNVDQPSKVLHKVQIVAATWVVGGMVGFAARKHIHESVDTLVETAQNIKGILVDWQTLKQVNAGELKMEESGLKVENYEKNEDDKWVEKDDPMIALQYKLDQINAGKSNFDREDLNQIHFYQNSEGFWTPIVRPTKE